MTSAPHAPTNRRAIAAEFLRFVGIMMTVGAALAILRGAGVQERFWVEARPLFFAALMPIGLAVWFLGLRMTNARRNGGSAGGDHHG